MQKLSLMGPMAGVGKHKHKTLISILKMYIYYHTCDTKLQLYMTLTTATEQYKQ